jgi:hypothetical protein
MPRPTRQDPVLPAPFPEETNPETREAASDSYLKVLPVGPHRLFAYWRLAPELRRRTEDLVTRPATGSALLPRVLSLGHGNDDVSVPFVWVWIDRYLAADGDASFVLKRDILKGPAGRLLRRGRVGSRRVVVAILLLTEGVPSGRQTADSAGYRPTARDDPPPVGR